MKAQISLEAFPVVDALIKNLLIFNFLHASTTATRGAGRIGAGQGNVRLAATLHNCKNNRAEKRRRRRRRRCRWVRDRERVRGSNEVVNINEEIFGPSTSCNVWF